MTDPKEKVASEALCRNHLSGFGEVCAGVCGDSTVPGQPHPCEHALTVWRSDAQEILRALLAGEGPVLPYEAFAKEMVRLAWDGAVDGGDVQEAAIKYGLIVPAKYDPAKHGENVEADVGDDIYEFTSSPSPAVRDAPWCLDACAAIVAADDAPLRRALRKLANAADDVGVKYFDTDTVAPLVEAMQTATQEARATLASTPPVRDDGLENKVELIARTLFTARAHGFAPSPHWDWEPNPLRAECWDDARDVAHALAVRDVTLREALERENEDLKAFIRGIGINCQRAAETLSQVAKSAAPLCLHQREGKP